MKYSLFVFATAFLLQATSAFGVETIEVDLDKNPLSCTKNMASSQNVWDVRLKHPIQSHRLSRFFVYPDGAEPVVCNLVDELTGKVKTQFILQQKTYTSSSCIQGGSYSCYKWGCFSYQAEYARVEFPNGLTLKSEHHSDGKFLHEGYCK